MSEQLINLKINGIDVQAEPGTRIIDAAASVGIEIPTLCYIDVYKRQKQGISYQNSGSAER